MNCWNCGIQVESSGRVGFRADCPKCMSPLHSCFNCAFHDPGYHNQCRETMAEVVADKERANFCEYFTASESRAEKPPDSPKKPGHASLAALFNKK